MLATITDKNSNLDSSLTQRNNKVINHLANFSNKNEIKAELVKIYLKSKNFDLLSIKNKIISELFSYSNREIHNYLMGLKRDWTLKDLEYIFYSFFDKTTINNNGIIFTPTIISNYITKELLEKIDNPNKTICDFSCGCGEFLISSLKQLKKKFPHISSIDIIENNLFGIDIIQENVHSTKLLLSLQALEFGEDKENIKFNIIKGDSTSPNILKQFNEPNILKGFDFIIGNPPYVKIQDLEPKQRTFLKRNFETCKNGNFNLFYSFIEFSYNYLNKDGKIGYIIPNHLLKMKSAESLRKFLLTKKLISKVIDFKDNQLFENAQTYSAIMFFDKKPKDKIYYKTVDEKVSIEKINKYLNNDNFQSVAYLDLNSDTINLLSKKEATNIRKIESQKYKLQISTGIATQKDSLYLIYTTKEINKNVEDGFYYKEYKGRIYKIEKDITISIIKGSGQKNIGEDANFYEFNRIIYPYKIENNKVITIPENEMKENYPETYKYFVAIKEELEKRNNGKPSVKIWYEYGRSQALSSFIPKIIFPTNSCKPNFKYFKDYALFNNGYAIYGTTPEENKLDLDVLEKILNSKVMDYYIKLTSYMISGGYYCYQKKYLKNFTVPEFSEQEISFLKNSKSNAVIDDFLIKKYDLDL